MDPRSPGPVFAWLVGSAETVWGGALLPLWTSTLAHISVVILALNLYWLVRLGRPLEVALGSPSFFAFLFTTAYIASASDIAFRGVGWGLSGVICAMAGFIWVSRAHYPVLHALAARNWSWFLLWWGFCFLTDCFDIGTGNEAHLGGFVCGAAMGAASLPRWRAVGTAATATLMLVAAVSVAWAPWNASWQVYQGQQALARHDLVSASRHARDARNGPERGRALWIEAQVAWSQKLRAMTIPRWQHEMQRFALGGINSQTLLERSQIGVTDVAVKAQFCEASTVIGALDESRDDVGDALHNYEKAVAACAGDDLYGAYARWRLRALTDHGHPPP